MNIQQKVQLGLGALLILGGVGLCFVNPVVGGVAISAGLSVVGFSNTMTKAITNSMTPKP